MPDTDFAVPAAFLDDYGGRLFDGSGGEGLGGEGVGILPYLGEFRPGILESTDLAGLVGSVSCGKELPSAYARQVRYNNGKGETYKLLKNPFEMKVELLPVILQTCEINLFQIW